MKCTATQPMLQNALTELCKVAEKIKDSIIPQTNHLMLVEIGTEKLTLSTGNLRQLSLSIRLDTQSEGNPTECMICPRELLRLVKKIPKKEELILSVLEEEFVISYGKNEFALEILTINKGHLFLEEPPQTTLCIPSKTMYNMLGKVMYAACQDAVRWHLCGLHMESRAEDITFTATDGHRLAQVTLPIAGGKSEGENLIINREQIIVAQNLLKTISKSTTPSEVYYSEEKRRVFLSSETFTSSMPQIDGSLPDVDQLIPKSTSIHISVDKKVLLEAVKVAQATAVDFGSNKGGIKICIERDFILKSSNGKKCRSKQPIEAENYTEGKKLEVGINSQYVVDAIGKLEGDTVHFYGINHLKPILFTSGNIDSPELHIIMPMRL